MTTLSPKMIEKNLCKKGFRLGNSKHRMLKLFVDGKETSIKSMVSHNGQEIGDALISKMSKQLKLSKEQFCAFASCQLNEYEYITILKESNII